MNGQLVLIGAVVWVVTSVVVSVVVGRVLDRRERAAPRPPCAGLSDSEENPR